MGILDSTTSQIEGNPADVQNTTDDWVNEIVKEKGEQWKDPQAIAKGYLHAQAEIARLKEFETKAKEQDYAKALLDRLQAQAPDPTPGKLEGPQGSSDAAVTATKPEDIESLINKTLSARDAQRVLSSNVATAEKYLEETFGEAADARVNEVAKNLRMTKEAMVEVAQKSPEAFKALVGKPEGGETNTTLKPSVNTTEFQSNSTDRNAAYYSKLRRENKSLYMSSSTQNQMIADRMRLGDKW